MSEFKVKAPADVRQLMQWWWVTLEPPYWYLRCRYCDLRRHLPWDMRWPTQEAQEVVIEHGEKCAEKFLHAVNLNTRVNKLGPMKERV